MATRKYLKILVSITLLFFVVAIPMNAYSKEAKDKIVFGGARPLSGNNAFFEANAYGPIYKFWVKEVNDKGGIFVKEYGKKLKIETKIYDDKSDMGTMTRLLEKLIVQDKVDFIFSPCSTAFLFAGAAVAKKYNYILMGGEGGATSMEKNLPNMPNVFLGLQYSNRYQMPALAEILAEQGAQTVAIIYIEDLHGIEYQSQATAELAKKGISVVMLKGVPGDLKDVSPLLKEAKKLNVDAFLAFTYPPVTFMVAQQAAELGINFKAMLLGPGGESLSAVVGKDMANGIMHEGAFSRKSSKAINEFVDKLAKFAGPAAVNWWGSAAYYAQCQVLEQAIERVGSLDQKKIMKVIATEKFDTILGKTYYKNQIMARECHPGQIGQWQPDGSTEVIDVGQKRTGKPVYPKPEWKKAAK
jgi:branched-chain amino acid transport system substrate-binding protein